LHSGLLGGSFDAGGITRLADDDWRRTDPEFTERLAANLTVVDALGEVAVRHGVSVATAAVAWTLSWPGVTAAIAGARSPEQVEGLVDALRVELDPHDLDLVAEAIRFSGAGQGPALPGAPFDTALLTVPPRSLHTFHRAPRRGKDGPLR
jgi:aryl-alcohol dehydrogenase-like predicted oxidoreductase